MWPRSTVEKLLAQHPDVITVVDEAYLAYGDAKSCIDLALAHPTTASSCRRCRRSGWRRCASACSSGGAELLAAVEKVRPPYNLSTLSQRAALKLVVDPRPSWRRTSTRSSGSGSALYDALGALPGLEIFPSGGNFLLVRATEGARALHDALVERGVLVRLFDAGLLAGCMRITVGTPEENSLAARRHQGRAGLDPV